MPRSASRSSSYENVTPPPGGKIKAKSRGLKVPTNPVIPVVIGDGTGPDIMGAAQPVLERAVDLAYSGERKLVWFPVLAGEAAVEEVGDVLPDDTLAAFQDYVVSLKGPLTTPVGGGFRSVNVAIRQILDLYACIRPVYYIEGVPAPVKHPEHMDVVIFRENTEDVYAGIEWKKGSKDARRLIRFLRDELGVDPKKLRWDAGIGIKPMSLTGTKRLVRKALAYAVEQQRESVTLVHKGNIMKFTEGAFRDWGYEVAKDEFRRKIVTEDEVWAKHEGEPPAGRVVVKDRIADNMLQQILTRTQDYDVIASPNLNGDYLSDACAAQVGGLGMAPGSNVGDHVGVFEATHGSAPKYAGQDKVNPGSVILSGAMMLEYMGWDHAAQFVKAGIAAAIKEKTVTYDLARGLPGVEPVACSEFGEAIEKAMARIGRSG